MRSPRPKTLPIANLASNCIMVLSTGLLKIALLSLVTLLLPRLTVNAEAFPTDNDFQAASRLVCEALNATDDFTSAFAVGFRALINQSVVTNDEIKARRNELVVRMEDAVKRNCPSKFDKLSRQGKRKPKEAKLKENQINKEIILSNSIGNNISLKVIKSLEYGSVYVVFAEIHEDSNEKIGPIAIDCILTSENKFIWDTLDSNGLPEGKPSLINPNQAGWSISKYACELGFPDVDFPF